LYEPSSERWDDMVPLLQLQGRLIGHSLDGKRKFYVMDGRVYVYWPGVDISNMDYFDFCQTLREKPPLGRLLDFRPEPPFHLGADADGEQVQPHPHDTMMGKPLAQRVSDEQAGRSPNGYELMYSHSGHGGPYPDMGAAVAAAARFIRGGTSALQVVVYIVPRNLRPLSIHNAVSRVYRSDIENDMTRIVVCPKGGSEIPVD
jgi:hypothetical protein